MFDGSRSQVSDMIGYKESSRGRVSQKQVDQSARLQRKHDPVQRLQTCCCHQIKNELSQFKHVKCFLSSIVNKMWLHDI